MNRKQKEKEATIIQQFHKHFQEVYGDRWESLFKAMKQSKKHCMLLNYFCDQKFILSTLQNEFYIVGSENNQIESKQMLKFFDCLRIPVLHSDCEIEFPRPTKDFGNIGNYYLLDAASLLAIEALDIQPEDDVFDVCAAPGGKSCAILQYLKSGTLTSNEPSGDRRRRLRRVFDDYVPKNVLEERISVTSYDAIKGFEDYEEYFDRVLVDVPCSSERHIVFDERISDWTLNMSAAIAKKQALILSKALSTVKSGGRLLYSTCSISPKENDQVIKKVISKAKRTCQIVRSTWPIGEPTKYGWIILPDNENCNWGPIYFCSININ